ncbi:class II fumarate hydratase [Mesorhizobium sp. M7A.F.Ca.US.006.01.1.1]|uniref:class II fumarate hydratase n=1 Tax=Mesorhizobium sp. M7A.F.Ca.US.006.01.1.1 TaxID=2496707 RepID=UPI000FCBFEC9|nr:class II fumarate hydratase [Mesorhizobium sp. M7A.F.Ca.US.006.01.1.1]RUZ73775.1 class II fumarate hydratase [Mesorhizobium sp. M7A.F.Ca.US.006.01.1.1]
MGTRTETDAYGAISIPDGAYWGPQTERSRILFAIGDEQLPKDVVRCFGAQKAAAARANLKLGKLPEELANAIILSAQEMKEGLFDDQFPISLWQTGSGTQTNMNANEVIANRANELLGHSLGARFPVHPNDHVNMGQSSNDTFPTIMHICTVRAVFGSLAPAMDRLKSALSERADEFHAYIKLGMTHLQDALPITLGSEFRTWERQIAAAWAGIELHAERLGELPQGGTASGSGVNGTPGFAGLVCEELGAFVGRALRPSSHPSQFMAAHDSFAAICGELNVLATAILKVCNDIRLLTSSLSGTPSLMLPDDGLSSSIMPSKRNATVCEAVIQVCLRVLGSSATVVAANAAGALQLNTCKPLVLHEVLNSIRLLSDAQLVLASGCISGLRADPENLRRALDHSPVLGAVLAPMVGYDVAARLTKLAVATGLPIREVIERDGEMDVSEFDRHLARVLISDTLAAGQLSIPPSEIANPLAQFNAK